MSEYGVSKYLNNRPASRKKHIYSRLLDYFSVFVVAYLFFTVFYYVGNQVPIVKGYNKQYETANHKIMDYIDESHLYSYNEKRTDFIDVDETTINYILNVTKTSAYIHDMQIPEYQPDSSYIMVDVKYEETFLKDLESYPLDNLSYYYKVFKKTDVGLDNYVSGGVDYKDDIDTYQYKKAMIVGDEEYHVTSDDPDYIARGESISTYLVLTSENTEKMINRVIKGEKVDEVANKLYNRLFNAYRRGIDFGTEDIEKHSLSYKKLYIQFTDSYQSITRSTAVIYVISYAFAYLLINGLVSLISKEWTTIGQKVMGLGLSDIHENDPSWWRLLIFYFTNFLLFFSSSMLSFYFIGIFGVLSYQIFPGFTLLAVMLFLLILNVLSIGMTMFAPKHNDLSTLASGIIIKDKNDFETTPEDDLINVGGQDDNQEDQGGEQD